MKTLFTLPIIAAAAVLLLFSPVNSTSQAPQPEALAALQKMKEENTKLLERQKATLEQLSELEEAARQTKIFASRS